MTLGDEQADILGGPILQRPEYGVFASFSQYHFAFKSVTLLGVGLLVWIACVRGLEHLKKHRELKYRKAMRRKHGIPDSDCRPFAVAYAAAKRAHLEREAPNRKKMANYVLGHNPLVVDQRTNAQKDACLLRKRVPESTVELHDYHLPGKHAAIYGNKRPEALSLDFADRYNPNPRRRVAVPKPFLVERPSVRASRKESVTNLDSDEESRKRSFKDDSDVEHETLKKSRTDADKLIDGDEQTNWYAQYSGEPSRRWSKEPLCRPSVDNHALLNERSSRIDDLGNEDHEADEAMEGADEDEVTQLKAVVRGKKRDQAEAGSTFGGDDEEDVRNGRASHRRKRRTILQRIETPARGQKRDREIQSSESEGDGTDSETSGRRVYCSSKKKRGKMTSSDEVGEMPVKDSTVSKDPLCGGRRISEGWEADGVQYKVGDKGERLRLTLVKKARNKYHMPQDSQHPDRSAALEIYVETWMTEEQYKQTEVRRELAWQEAPRESSGSKTPDALHSPTKNGKNLLWDSVKCSPARRSFHQLVPPGASTRINPFEQWQAQPILGRRVASSSAVVSPILPGVVGSPTRPGFRGFSKWEKQDREAEAMARIRAKIEEQRKAQPSPLKLVEIPAGVTASEHGSKSLRVPTITLTPAPAVAEKSNDSTPQSRPNSSTFPFANPPGTNDSVKGTAAAGSTTIPGFSPSSASISPATLPALFPGVPTASTATSSTGSLSPFSFVSPQQVPLSSSSTLPNIFGKGGSAGTLSLPTSSPSTLGITTQPQPPSTKNTSKSVSFTFSQPGVPPSSPPVVVPPATKSQLPVFNGTSSSSSSPVTFGFIPAATKAETQVLHVSTPANTPDSSKPVNPLFSFLGAPSSTGTLPISSPSSVPKFSFGQPSTISTLAPSPSPVAGTGSQPKSTLNFSQTPPGATDGASVVAVPDESKKSAMPALASVTAAGLNEPTKPSPFGATSAFGNSSFKSSSTSLFGKPVIVDNGSSITTPPKPPLLPASATTSDSTIPTSTVRSTSGHTPIFSFGGANSASKSSEGFKPASLFGGVAGSSNGGSTLSGNSMEGKSTFAFGTSAVGAKPTSSSGNNIESSKAPSLFGGPTEGSRPTFAFSSAESTKSATPFATPSDSSKPSDTTGLNQPIPTPGSTMFGAFSASPFAFGKDDAATASVSTSTSTQTKPAVSFDFGVPLVSTGSMFGQPSTFTTSGDSSQSVFGKPTNATSGAFGFAGTGPSSSNTFAFGKPVAQNQKQEQ